MHALTTTNQEVSTSNKLVATSIRSPESTLGSNNLNLEQLGIFKDDSQLKSFMNSNKSTFYGNLNTST